MPTWVHRNLPRAGRRLPIERHVAPRAGPSYGLRGQAATEPLVHCYAAALAHIPAAVDTDGSFYVTSDGSGLTSTPQWIAAADQSAGGNWSSWRITSLSANFTNNQTYRITAEATDGVGRVTTTEHQFLFFDVFKQFTTLNLTTSTSSIFFGGALDVSMKLTNPADLNADLSISQVLLDVNGPNGVTVTIGPFLTNTNGQVTVSGLGLAGNGLLSGGGDLLFDKKGTWTLQARFAGTLALAASNSESGIVLVGTSAGYAVVVEGKIANNEGLASHNKTANRIYRTLLKRGFADQNIFYFNHDPSQDANQDGLPDNSLSQAGIGVDAVPTKSGIRATIEGLAAVVNNNPAPVYVVFVDHGAPAPTFLLGGGETITPAELDGWLDALEAGLSTEARKEPRVVVVGTCYSGGFIPQLSGPNRLIVASAAADEESYKGPREADGIRVGEFFLEEFFQELGRGSDFRTSFQAATVKTEDYTRTGGASKNSANQYFDAAEQHPLLDDDGDGAGSNVLDLASSDGALAAGLFLGTGPNHDTNSADNPADITAVTATLFLSNAQSQAALELFANDTAQVSQAYVEIRAPATQLAPEGGTEQLETNYTRRQLLPPGGAGNPHGDRFYLLADGFTAPGKYEVYYYVQDVETGALSPARRSVVYKNLGTNAQPATFDLLSPLAGATVKTVGIFDWGDTTDPNGHDLT